MAAILASSGFNDASNASAFLLNSALAAGSAAPNFSAMAAATTSMVFGSYQRWGLSPGCLPIRSAATVSARSGEGSAAVSFSIQGS